MPKIAELLIIHNNPSDPSFMVKVEALKVNKKADGTKVIYNFSDGSGIKRCTLWGDTECII